MNASDGQHHICVDSHTQAGTVCINVTEAEWEAHYRCKLDYDSFKMGRDANGWCIQHPGWRHPLARGKS
jgi:hypothetical protein